MEHFPGPVPLWLRGSLMKVETDQEGCPLLLKNHGPAMEQQDLRDGTQGQTTLSGPPRLLLGRAGDPCLHWAVRGQQLGHCSDPAPWVEGKNIYSTSTVRTV